MALTTCYECGDRVSSLAEGCPHCGAPMKNRLIHASMRGNVENVNELINRGTDVNSRDEDGLTALITACREGQNEVCKLLLGNHADPRIKDKNGWTPLMWAAATGRTEIVKMLLDHGANA